MRIMLTLLLAYSTTGCAAKRALRGEPHSWTSLPKSAPTATFAEALCPGEEAPESPPTGRMFLMKSGAIWDWAGDGDSYFTRYPRNSWRYKANDPGIARWMVLVDDTPTTGGTAHYFVEDFGGRAKLGQLVLIPNDGDQAYRIVLSKKTKLQREDGVFEVQPIPKSIPLGVAYCYARQAGVWPDPTPPATADFFFRADPATLAEYQDGDRARAEAMWLASGIPWIARFADEELEQMLYVWHYTAKDTSVSFEQIPRFAGAKTKDDLWEAILEKYDALVEAGKAPALPEPAPIPD